MILVLKRHTYNFFALARRDTEQLPLSSAKPVPATRSSDVANNDFRGSLADAHRRECGGPDAGEAEEWALPDLAPSPSYSAGLEFELTGVAQSVELA
jgi:hypothetical protein